MKIHDFRHLFLQLNKGFENFVVQIDNFSLGIAKLFFGKIDLLRKIKSSGNSAASTSVRLCLDSEINDKEKAENCDFIL